ncbi:MAG: hypothetical protein FWC09_04495 [Lachnospiraceae bacterium]|nr:hypothetical protein [Lachnospiraceae bacterium]
MEPAVAEKSLIEITSCPVATTNKKMVIAGVINSTIPNLQLFINSEEQKILNGKFMVSLPLDDGANDFEIVLADEGGALAKEVRSIFCGFLPPKLTVDDLPDVTKASKIVISGTALDVNQHKSILTLKINGEVIEISPDGKWETNFNLKQGTNNIDIMVFDGGLRKTVIRKLVEQHPLAPEIVFEGIGPIITSRQMEFIGHLENFDHNKMDIRIHSKIVPVNDKTFRYKTNIRTDKAEIPISIDIGGRTVISFTRQVVFLPSPPTVTIDNEIKQISATHCRISGTINDENDINPKVFVNDKEVNPRAGAWTATLVLNPGINTIVIEGRNHTGLKRVIKKKILVPEEV